MYRQLRCVQLGLLQLPICRFLKFYWSGYRENKLNKKRDFFSEPPVPKISQALNRITIRLKNSLSNPLQTSEHNFPFEFFAMFLFKKITPLNYSPFNLTTPPTGVMNKQATPLFIFTDGLKTLQRCALKHIIHQNRKYAIHTLNVRYKRVNIDRSVTEGHFVTR